MAAQKLIPTKINLDLAPEYFDGSTAKFIKNLTEEVGATNENSGATEGGNTRKQKPNQSNELYVFVPLPAGNNLKIGGFTSNETNEVFVCIHNSNKNHLVYRINGSSRTANIVYQGPELNFILSPENFIGISNAWLEVIYLTDPATGAKVRRTFLFITDGKNYQRQIAVEDSIATSSFNKDLFGYFQGDYEKETLINMGLPTPKDCIEVTEVTRTVEDYGQINTLLFNTWQFRVSTIDVWGRPSEHGIISDLYVPGINDCFASSPSLARCLNLKINAGSPIIDKIQIEYRNGNDTQWYLDSVISLYTGSNIGAWWLRTRNPDVAYNAGDNTIDVTFCRNREKTAIPVAETARLYNPLPRSSQGLTKIGDVVALTNNVDGFLPFSDYLRKKIEVSVEGPQSTGTDDLGNITIYVPMWGEVSKFYGSVYKSVDGTPGYVFGGMYQLGTATIYFFPRPYNQYFANQSQTGFLGYLNDGDSVISTQVYVDDNGNIIDDPDHKFGLKFTMQKFVFTNKRRAKYIFRLASHLADTTINSNFQNTSTLVWGLCPYTRGGSGQFNIDTPGRLPTQELLIDLCTSDYSSLNDNKLLCILDVSNNNEEERVTSGYIYETVDDGAPAFPMELVKVTSVNGFTSGISDHNGFYYFATKGEGRNFAFNFNYKCAPSQFVLHEGAEGMNVVNIQMDGVIPDNGFAALYPDYATTPCHRILIKGRVVLSGTNIGVPNSYITLTRGYTTITDSDGYFTLVAHDDMNNFTTGRDDKLLLGNSCNYKDEDKSCIDLVAIHILPCSVCVERVVQVGDAWKLFYENSRGPLSGGTYSAVVTAFDWLGRATFGQDLGYIRIPTIIQSGTIGPSKIKVKIPPLAVFPTYFKYLTFSLSQELTIDKYVTWIVDSLVFVDNTGMENNINPTQIKIYYNSLNEFNKQNNFSTTTNWQFLAPAADGGEQLAYQSDVVQFYINGDGTYFPRLITALVKYDKTGQYFLIDYTSDLKYLKPNAYIRLARPKNIVSDTELHYEVCHVVNLKDGIAQENEFYLNVFDTYYPDRQIPVPAVTPPSSTITEIATTVGDVTTYETPAPAIAAIQQRSFGFRFEHDSPSNFWGQGAKNIGRVNVKNPYETELFHINQFALSGPLSETGQLNFLNYFRETQKTTFNLPNLGGITAAIYEMGLVWVLCQYDNFTVGYNDNLARVDSKGNIQVPSADNQFGKPERQVGDRYGCQIYDKNTIAIMDGIVSFLDSNRGELIKYNFSTMESYSQGQCDSWLRKKIKIVRLKKGDKYWVGSINPINGRYLLTDFSLLQNSYLNQLRDVAASTNEYAPNETVSFNMFTREMKQFHSFTPEGYAYLNGDTLNKQLFTFLLGQPYAHYNVNENNSFNKFYGVKCEKVFRTIFNLSPDTKKMALSIAVYCQNEKYFSDQILTDSKQFSRLLLDAWNKGEYFYFAPFYCDLNTVADPNLPDQTGKNKLLDGDRLYGGYIDVRLVGEPAKMENYSELLDVIIFASPNASTGSGA